MYFYVAANICQIKAHTNAHNLGERVIKPKVDKRGGQKQSQKASIVCYGYLVVRSVNTIPKHCKKWRKKIIESINKIIDIVVVIGYRNI